MNHTFQCYIMYVKWREKTVQDVLECQKSKELMFPAPQMTAPKDETIQ